MNVKIILQQKRKKKVKRKKKGKRLFVELKRLLVNFVIANQLLCEGEKLGGSFDNGDINILLDYQIRRIGV